MMNDGTNASSTGGNTAAGTISQPDDQQMVTLMERESYIARMYVVIIDVYHINLY